MEKDDGCGQLWRADDNPGILIGDELSDDAPLDQHPDFRQSRRPYK